MGILGSAQTGTSVTQILSWATEMFAWFIEQMTDLVGFITQNPAILIMFIIALCGAVIGMFTRVWHSV